VSPTWAGLGNGLSGQLSLYSARFFPQKVYERKYFEPLSLTNFPLDDADVEALTPNHFLGGNSSGLRERGSLSQAGDQLPNRNSAGRSLLEEMAMRMSSNANEENKMVPASAAAARYWRSGNYRRRKFGSLTFTKGPMVKFVAQWCALWTDWSPDHR